MFIDFPGNWVGWQEGAANIQKMQMLKAELLRDVYSVEEAGNKMWIKPCESPSDSDNNHSKTEWDLWRGWGL